MELFLFNKKSKFKFLILAIVLLSGTFLMTLTKLILYYTVGGLGYIITSMVVEISIGFNYLILGIVSLILLGKTAKEDENLKLYKNSMSSGIIFLFILFQLIYPIKFIVYLVYYLTGFPYEIYYWVFQGEFFLTSLFFIIGIILLSVGARKTVLVPLTFSREKKGKITKRNPTQSVYAKKNTCPKCGAPIPSGAEFCTSCGNHI